MNFFAIICFICASLAFFAGYSVWMSGFRKKLNQSWALFNFSIAIWMIGLGETMNVDNELSALVAQKILYIGTIMIPLSFSYFAALLSKKEENAEKLLYINSSAAAFFLATLFLGRFFIEKILERTDFGYFPIQAGTLYYPFLAWFAVMVIYGFVLLRGGLRNKAASAVEKQQISFMMWGAMVGFIAGSVNFLLDFGIVIPPFYNLLVPSYLLFVGYAIATKQFFGIKVIFTEMLVVGMGMILMVLPFFMPNFILQVVMVMVFVVFCLFGYMLIRSMLKEVRQKDILAGMVQERTKELEASKKVAEERAAELEKWYNLTIGRELRMAELKGKIKEIEDKNNQANN
ncbi:MAG: histidine kinase N-terminal 7TM domain-containing protein [Candidatus Paceibacterota bacterium]